VKTPTGVEAEAIARWGDPATGPQLVAGDHWLAVPVDHNDPSGPLGTLRLYAREVRLADRVDDDLPYLVFLQGGPGGRSPRPTSDGPAWLEWALQRYRVLLLDQRGTGRSTPMDRYSLPLVGDTARQVEYLACHRGDAIVADCEALRRRLLGDQPWVTLGQSFGGFCTWSYLSFAPEGLDHAYVTGGIPPTATGIDSVYTATYAALARRVGVLDALNPGVRVELAAIARHLETDEELLPTGERLTPSRLQEIGIVLGSATGVDQLGYLVADAWSLPGRKLSDIFLSDVADIISFAKAPLYALIHEALYAGPGDITAWSAQRIRTGLGIAAEPVPGVAAGQEGEEVLELTGEMIYPHTVRKDPPLAPLAEVADRLAERVWDRPLYDLNRLAENRVPVVCLLYTQDMYVDPELSRATAARTAGVVVIENEVQHHDGLRRNGAEILQQLDDALLAEEVTV
jgi:pimeloyl-ACP methyl ester carboxylesterase